MTTPASKKETTMATDTSYTLDQFLADTRATIKATGVPSGLAEIRDHLEKLLHNPELLKEHLGDPPPYTRLTTIGHDPETDVHVLVHGREKAGKSSVHDHGPCWVVYGNYKNPTRMRRWRRLDDGSRPGHAELDLQREFLNEPGHAAAMTRSSSGSPAAMSRSRRRCASTSHRRPSRSPAVPRGSADPLAVATTSRGTTMPWVTIDRQGPVAAVRFDRKENFTPALSWSNAERWRLPCVIPMP
jgi:hypothetical protein